MFRRTTAAVIGVGALSAAAVGSTAAAAAPAAAKTPTITVTLTDKAATGVPSTLRAGWYTFAGVSKAKDERGLVIAKLKPGATKKKVSADSKSGSDTAFFSLLKELSFAGGASPNKGSVQRSATVHLTPGTYAVESLATEDGPNAVPTYVTVTPGSVGSKPTTNASVGMDDFNFKFAGIGAGTKVVSFHNESAQAHEFQVTRVDPGHSRADVLQALQGDQPPSWIHDEGNYGIVSPKNTMIGTLKLRPGTHYLIVCFLPDTSMKMYMPHAAEGMYAFVGF